MRISLLKDDDGYNNYRTAKHNGKTVHVFLDGVEYPYCVTADDEEGFIVFDVIDDEGNFVLDEKNENTVRETVKGIVKIELRDNRYLSG